MGLKEFLTISISAYNQEIKECECKLLEIENTDFKDRECKEIRKIYELIQYNSCMMYAYEQLLNEL